MKNTTSFLIKQYAKMPGSKKVELGISLSKVIRQVRRDGNNYKKSPSLWKLTKATS
ncbi:hypothetical protein HYT02_04425 [Candidatus Gottesmanbacteria bacterium]|nr:hypothetical protein [Candidatus Gottesmanbacteria bacterium]